MRKNKFGWHHHTIIEWILIPTIAVYRGGYKREHRQYGDMWYFICF